MIELLNIDCMEYMKDVPDKAFDLAIVDPPYGINMAKWDYRPTRDYWWQLFRTSKNQIVFGGNYFDRLPRTEAWICWDKTFNDDVRGKKLTKGGCPRKDMSDFELIWTSFNKKSKFLRFTQIGNLIGFGTDISVDYNHKAKIHPTQKHELIYKWIIKNYAKEGDKIIDTHLGSGSSAIAANDLGFDFVGCEIDKEYFDSANKRFKEYTLQVQMF